MHHFNIRDVENLSGIKAHTLRIWEQRYGLQFCKRKESKHRYYDNDDLKHILRLAHLYHRGYKISRLAQMDEALLLQLASTLPEKNKSSFHSDRLIEAALDFNAREYEQTLGDAVAAMGLERAIAELIYPHMDRIGVLWLTNHVMPGQEHFSSHLIKKRIILEMDRLPRGNPRAGFRVAVFAPEGEEHEIPLLFVQYLLRKNRIQVSLIGRNTSLDMLQEYCDRQPVTHLYFHLITNFTDSDPGDYVSRLQSRFPGKKIIASGPAVGALTNADSIKVIRSVEETISVCEQLF